LSVDGAGMVGRAVDAVLISPQAERFASVVGVDLDRLMLNASGLNKLILLDSDRVFLFPRSASGVEWFERELTAYRVLGSAVKCRLSRRPSSSNWAGPAPAGMSSSRLDVESRPLEVAFCLRHALLLLDDPGDPAVAGTIEEQLAEL
jgi:hypothetical protein